MEIDLSFLDEVEEILKPLITIEDNKDMSLKLRTQYERLWSIETSVRDTLYAEDNDELVKAYMDEVRKKQKLILDGIIEIENQENVNSNSLWF